jgi:hypothetical protein
LLVGILFAYILLHSIPVSHDVICQMWIARQLLGGAALYTDILELNPPLWFWMAVPVEWVAQAFGLPSTEAIVAAVFLMITAALFLLAVLLADKPPVTRAMLLAAAFLAMVLLQLPHFAQREHLSLIGAVAYLALIARRIDERETDWRAAAAVGLIGGMGFALKHYFVLVPVLLENLAYQCAADKLAATAPRNTGPVCRCDLLCGRGLAFRPSLFHDHRPHGQRCMRRLRGAAFGSTHKAVRGHLGLYSFHTLVAAEPRFPADRRFRNRCICLLCGLFHTSEGLALSCDSSQRAAVFCSGNVVALPAGRIRRIQRIVEHLPPDSRLCQHSDWLLQEPKRGRGRRITAG